MQSYVHLARNLYDTYQRSPVSTLITSSTTYVLPTSQSVPVKSLSVTWMELYKDSLSYYGTRLVSLS